MARHHMDMCGSTRRLFRSALFLLIGLTAALNQPSAQTKTLRVGVYENPPKLELADEQTPGGILGDLLREIARREDWRLETVPCRWRQCLTWLESGRLDLMPDVAWSPARARRFAFHETPALRSWSRIYQAPHLNLASPLDLDGKRLALLRGSIQESYLRRMAANFGLEVGWLPTDELEDAFQAVAAGRADAVATNYLIGDRQARRLDLAGSPILFQPARLFYAAPGDGDPAVLAAIDHHLETWKSDPDSIYYDILARWGVGEKDPGIPVYVWWVIAALSGCLVVALGFNALLHRKVAKKTRALRHSELRLSTILDTVDAYIFIKDRDLHYDYVNHKGCELLQLSRENILGQGDERFFDTATVRQLQDDDRRVLEAGERVVREETIVLARGGKERQLLTVKMPLRESDGRIHGLCGVGTDITEYRDIQNQLHELAHFDPLTGLPNRRMLIQHLQHALAARERTGSEGALLLVDLDNFKTVNDTLGHNTGDRLLQAVAERLRTVVRDTDTIGRLGADEFLVIVEHLGRDTDRAIMEASNLAGQIQTEMSPPFPLAGANSTISTSIGVALFSDGEGDIDALLKEADLALFDAKSAGRDAMRFFNPAMQTAVNRRSRLEAGLRRALVEDRLELHLQPQREEDHITGMEALLRWRDPEMGTISPAEFIPVAEASGMMIPLGRWVMERACAILREWGRHPATASLTIAINVSPRQFLHDSFVTDLTESLRKQAVAPRRLELEFTESLMIEDMEKTIARMEELHERGIRFTLDDFGTGYASLGYLKRLPLYRLKIDMEFIRDLRTDANDEAIVRTIIALGKSLDLRVIAEGVENAEQSERLRELGCRAFQGYHFGHPRPAEDWLRELAAQG